MTLSLAAVAKALGGEVRGDRVEFPSPGHSAQDRGSWAKIEPGAPDGLLVYCSNGDARDWLAAKEKLREAGVLPPLATKDHAVLLKAGQRIVATFEFRDPDGALLYRKHRIEPGPDGRKKEFRYDRPNGAGGWRSGAGDRRVPYRAGALACAEPGDTIFLTEGEAKADLLASWGFVASSLKDWKEEAFAAHIAGRDVVIVPDNDATGEKLANLMKGHAVAAKARPVILRLPRLNAQGTDILNWDGDAAELRALAEAALALAVGAPAEAADEPAEEDGDEPSGVSLHDFWAYMVPHNYIFAPTGDSWPAASVNSRIPPVHLVGPDGKPTKQKASAWLDENRAVEQMTWSPGEPMIIADRLISDGGRIDRPGCSCFNLYRPPVRLPGDPKQAGPWLEHIRRIYPDDADHIIPWLAHRVQRPHEKINHALLLGGAQGIGKDTILEPVKQAVGPWNFAEVFPHNLFDAFNSFARSVILRISEAQDLGDFDRFAFYDHMKTYTAAPPDVLRVNEKHLRQYNVSNVCGVVITTNHRTDALYLPADDRRHYVAWSTAQKEDFDEAYWRRLYGWYVNGGNGHVAAYLAAHDLSGFDPKAPPPKTEAFWAIVDFGVPQEDSEMRDAIDRLGKPDVLTIAQAANATTSNDFRAWLGERKNRWLVPHRFEACKYEPVRNPNAEDGLWKLPDGRAAIYGRSSLSLSDRIAAAQKLLAKRPSNQSGP